MNASSPLNDFVAENYQKAEEVCYVKFSDFKIKYYFWCDLNEYRKSSDIAVGKWLKSNDYEKKIIGFQKKEPKTALCIIGIKLKTMEDI